MWKKFLLDTLLPQFCLGCGKEGSLICQDCLSTIEILEFQYCPFCQKANRLINGEKCQLHHQTKLDGLFSATSYKNTLVKSLIAKFKYQPFLKNLKEPLAYLIIAHFLLTENKTILKEAANCFLMPVPLSNKRKRWRGFNQSEELAKIVAAYFKVPLLTNNLQKVKNNQPQIELSKEQRKENIKGVFQLKNPELIRNKTIFLIDDVFTSGATLEECASILKSAGAEQVWGIVVARETI